MHHFDASTDSVNSLITQLCHSTARQYGIPEVQSNAAARKLKAKAFGILLHKSDRPAIESDDRENADYDVQRAAEAHIFAVKLNAHRQRMFAGVVGGGGQRQERVNMAELEGRLTELFADEYFTVGPGRLTLQFLLLMQNNLNDSKNDADRFSLQHSPELLVPGPFTLHAQYQNNRHYPNFPGSQCATEQLLYPQPRFFKGLADIQCAENPYMPKFLFEGERNQLAEIEKKYAAPTTATTEKESCGLGNLARQLWGTSLRIDVRPFRLFADCGLTKAKQQNTHDNNINSERSGNEKTPLVVATKQPPPVQTEPRIFAWNWESLDECGIKRHRPFASEANVSVDLCCHHVDSLGRPFEAKILSQSQFMQDVKSLVVGIQSDTFHYDNYFVFHMEAHITVAGLLPATIRSYVGDFLECGSCYKRLQIITRKPRYDHIYEGFMYKAICGAVDEYLLTFRQFVYGRQNEALMGLHKRLQKIIKQIANLSNILGVHHAVESGVKPPSGSLFLGYMYREIIRVTEKDLITLLMFVLKRCCHVYFKHLQKWIFYGLLDDPHEELFIGFTDHYREHTKHYYDKAFFVRKEAVPGFFQNFEDQLLQCGKYTRLLKAYKPNHPIFDLEYPTISVCLTFAEIEKLEAACSKYYERARELCGKPISIQKIFETRAEQKREFLQAVAQRSRANMDKWSLEQHALAVQMAAQKRKRLQELSTQLEDARARKIAERRANVEQELLVLREAERVETARLMGHNINLRKRIEYYQELYDLMREDDPPARTKTSGAQQSKTAATSPASTDTPPSTATPARRTPNSRPCSEFESCDDDEDEDASSEYVECLSEDFLQKFAENEGDLQALATISESDEAAAKAVQAGDASNNNNNNPLNDVDIVLMPPPPAKLKRSVSDVLNSNELPDGGGPAFVECTELQESRRKALSGSNMALCLNQHRSATIDDPTVAALRVSSSPPPPLTVAMAEAKRNKLRVMTHDSGSLPDINLNTLSAADSIDQLTELQRNRRRMMQNNDTFAGLTRDPMAERALLRLDLDTDRARNRRKVLASEFDILTGIETRPSKATCVASSAATMAAGVDVATPMSTTSDTPLNETAAEARARCDLENGNAERRQSLKVDIAAANASGAAAAGLRTLASVATTAGVEETPEWGLNTAGLVARHGFQFDETIKLPMMVDDDVLAVDPTTPGWQANYPAVDYGTPYKRCIELLESNFQCDTRSPHLRLNRTPNERLSAKASATSLAARKSSQMLREFNLNSMSVITLTEFLQKSVIKPMTVHLELMNNEVMRLFLEDLRVLDHMRSLRHYFLLMDGEFGAKICDGIIGQLENGAMPQKLLNYQMLHSILDTALGSSMTGHAKNAENLSFIVKEIPEKFELASPGVLDTLSLSYRIDWPLNLILTPDSLEMYAKIFRYLIKVRRISWLLEGAYQRLQIAAKQHGPALLGSPQYRHIQQIRHKLYHFVHSLQQHVTANALQASWKTFKDDLLQAKSLEAIYRKHTKYVKNILFLCMLNRHSTEFYNIIELIFSVILRFCYNLKMREFRQCSKTAANAKGVYFTHSRYEKMAAEEKEFNKHMCCTIGLGNKIVKRGYQSEIGEFIRSINYNDYYTKLAAKLKKEKLRAAATTTTCEDYVLS